MNPMHALKTLATLMSRLAALLVAAPAEPQRPLTEDDIRADRYLRRQHARG
jgi:hypothetical protein